MELEEVKIGEERMLGYGIGGLRWGRGCIDYTWNGGWRRLLIGRSKCFILVIGWLTDCMVI